jgi:predicted Mrr-cat superfamily restriction endonuclease
MLYSFANRAQVGDLVLYPPTWREPKIHVGKITSGYEFKRWKLLGYHDQRSVEWFTTLPRSRFSKVALRGIGVHLAFFQVRSEVFLSRLQELLAQ